MWTKTAIGVVLSVASMGLGACSESVGDGEGGAGGEAGAVSSSSAEGGAGGAGTTTSSTGAGSGGAGAGGGSAAAIVLNEISADGDDYVELYNPTSQPVDLSGLSLADAESAGVPKLAEAITFPAATIVEPGAYLFVLAKVDTATSGEVMRQLDCAPGPSPCFHAAFGLSAADGDEIFLLDGETILMSAAYPAGAAPGGSWGRFPNGTGDFAENQPTPGEANALP